MSEAEGLAAIQRQLQARVTEVEAVTLEIATLDEQLKAKKALLESLTTETIPSLVRESDQMATRATLPDGTVITLKDEFHVSVSEPNRPAAYAFLAQHGHGDAIEYEITARFGKGQAKLADRVRAFFASEPEFATVTVEGKQSVHASTLKARLKKLAKERALPDCVSVYAPTRAIITRPAASGAPSVSAVVASAFGDDE